MTAQIEQAVSVLFAFLSVLAVALLVWLFAAVFGKRRGRPGRVKKPPRPGSFRAIDYSVLNRPVDRSELRYAGERADEPDASLFCRKCGNRLPADSVFCQYCGTKIRSE